MKSINKMPNKARDAAAKRARALIRAVLPLVGEESGRLPPHIEGPLRLVNDQL